MVENDQIYYLRTDHIGRPRFATDAAELTVWQANYLPFGKLHATTGNNPDLRFPGQWFQAESGLFQNWMRDYDPTLGRYLQADPLGLVDGPSIYGYALQNPQRYLDPRGEQSSETVKGALCLTFPMACKTAGIVDAMKPRACPADGDVNLDDLLPPIVSKAPGKPTESDGFFPPKHGPDGLVKGPDGRSKGYRDKNGNVWIPTGEGATAHGGPHWDVKGPRGGYINVYPGGNTRGGKNPRPKLPNSK